MAVDHGLRSLTGGLNVFHNIKTMQCYVLTATLSLIYLLSTGKDTETRAPENNYQLDSGIGQ